MQPQFPEAAPSPQARGAFHQLAELARHVTSTTCGYPGVWPMVIGGEPDQLAASDR
jgi:hypothetical protein